MTLIWMTGKMSSPIRSSGGRRAAVGGKGIRLFREGEDHLATDLVLVVPEAGVDRVEWAKQLVGNAVRSPHTRQAYHYAPGQFFQWAAGRAISRESVQGYVTWPGEMKFSPSTINRRTNEIGIRMALGANRSGILSLILREAGWVLGVGVGVGIVLSLAGARAAKSLLYGLTPYDPLTLVAAIALIAIIAIAASSLPAQRASKLNPMVALREE